VPIRHCGGCPPVLPAAGNWASAASRPQVSDAQSDRQALIGFMEPLARRSVIVPGGSGWTRPRPERPILGSPAAGPGRWQGFEGPDGPGVKKHRGRVAFG